jgi:predicted metal-binding membrane protein
MLPAPRSIGTLARAHRAVLLVSSSTVMLASWLWLTRTSAAHFHLAVLYPHVHDHPSIGSFISAVVMCQAMTVAMMTPTTLNWLFAFAALVSRSESRHTFRAVGAFAAGYFFVWLGYSVFGATVQMTLRQAGFIDHGGKLPSPAAAIVLIGAGVVYFTPLSRACLRHCRNPLSYFVANWDNGTHGGFRFGVAHGAYCVGCCWALMLTGFAMGVMNLVWMGLLTILVCVEKLAPHGDRIGRIAAVALIVWGTVLLR